MSNQCQLKYEKLAVYKAIFLYELNNYISFNKTLLSLASTSSSVFEIIWNQNTQMLLQKM